MPYETIRVLIWGKTYPELSTKYTETVCTGGLREDGRPIRLYPVPLRYLEDPRQYSLYEWIKVPVAKSTRDPRPESYKVDPAGIVRGDFVGTDKGTWRQRREIVLRDTSWHFGSVANLRAAEWNGTCSIGMVAPRCIDEVELFRKPAAERAAYKKKSQDLQLKKEADFFDPSYKQLEYLPCEIRLWWRCAEPCETCKRKPHGMKVLDWGLLELARRKGWDKAVEKMRTISDLRTHDFRLFLGNFRLHPKNFGIIGLWYPKHQHQQELALR